MMPFRFGPPGRQLFALHQPPVAADRGKSVLLCNPFGQEAIRCHRMYRVLGDRLARAGVHVLRFDYRGTGDADGNDGTGDLSSWKEDILAADAELARLATHTKRSWFGLRLGGTLAALASSTTSSPPQKLVMWDPIVDGPMYLDELVRAHIEAYASAYGARWQLQPVLRERAQLEAHAEALGFPIGAAVRDQLASLGPVNLQKARCGGAWLFAGPDAQFTGALAEQLASRGIPVHQMSITSRTAWASNEAMNSSIVPADSLASVVSALVAD